MKEGFYWLKYNGKWIPAEYKSYGNGYWFIVGDDCPIDVDDRYIGEVGERIERKVENKKMETRKGWINIHYCIETGKIYCSTKPYDTQEIANTGIFIGQGIYKLGCFEIEYPYDPVIEALKYINK